MIYLDKVKAEIKEMDTEQFTDFLLQSACFQCVDSGKECKKITLEKCMKKIMEKLEREC